MQPENENKKSLMILLVIIFFIILAIQPAIAIVLVYLASIFLKKNPEYLSKFFKTKQLQESLAISESEAQTQTAQQSSLEKILTGNVTELMLQAPSSQEKLTHLPVKAKLNRRTKYLQIALNSSMDDAINIISNIPNSERILVEAGTPLIKKYGMSAISRIRYVLPNAYIVADNKCADLASREVEMISRAGANAATCLGVAPIETIDSFIEQCRSYGIDSMVDMMNVTDAMAVMKKLKNPPTVVVLHRGVDESEFSKEKQIPYYQIKQIKGSYNIMVSVAGGDTAKEAQKAIFNDADIVVVWKNFYSSNSQTAELAKSFLKEVR